MIFKEIKLLKCLDQIKDSFDIQNSIDYKQITVSNTWIIKLRWIKKWSSIWTKRQFYTKKGLFIYSRLWLHTWAFWIVPDFLDWAIVTWDMPVFKINENIILKDFLILSLNSNFYKNQVNWLNKWVAQSRIREKIFLNLKISIPEINDQKILLENYDKFKIDFDNLSNITNKNLSYIKQLKQAILQEAIEWKLTISWRENNPNIESASILLEKIKKEKDELVKQKKLKKQEKLKEISEDEIPFEIPENWSWCRLNDLWIIKWWKRMPSWSFFSKWKTNYWYLRVSDMKSWWVDINNLSYIDDKTYDLLKSYIINDTDLYMTIVWWTIWKCGVLQKELDWVILTENALKITPILIDKYYIYNYLISNYAQNEFKNKTNQLWVQKLAMIQFKKTFFPLPPLEEQKEIVKKVDELMGFCDELEKQSLETKKNSENLMKSVLSEVFNW
jgi:type I restriction enzyme S subunit